jgi:wyosine [tRNA(Phe)-imidazoG37] synthetase (radical SAM superfamily)
MIEDNDTKHAKAFGPVPSRRLGNSLGINNIPYKVCSYGCIYCQVGRTTRLAIARQAFYAPRTVFQEVRNKLAAVHNTGQQVDYLTFVPDGDPTLDIHLGDLIDRAKTLGVPVGVLTNGALAGNPRVRAALAKADLVSLKVDAVHPQVWRKINRPHKTLRLSRVLEGIAEFANAFSGKLLTETLLVRGVNDTAACLNGIAQFLRRLKPKAAYLSVPIRPPTESWVRTPDEKQLNRAYQIFTDQGLQTEYLIGYEGDAFHFTGDIKNNILSITAVHPMRKQALEDLLTRSGTPWTLVDQLIASGALMETEYNNHRFYLRKIKA